MTRAQHIWQLVSLPSVKLTLKYMTVAILPSGELVLLRHARPTSRQHTVLLVLR